MFAQTRFFIQSEMTVGKVLEGSKLESNEFSGFVNERRAFESWDLEPQRTHWSYGAGMKGGIVVNNFLYIYTGARYRKVINEGIFYCILCDYIVEESTLLELDFLEIPLGVRVNFFKNKRLQPYFSSEVFWSKKVGQKEIPFFGGFYNKNLDLFRIAYKAGAAYKIGTSKNWEISVQSGLNTNLGKQKSYPRYDFREVTAEVGVLRVF